MEEKIKELNEKEIDNLFRMYEEIKNKVENKKVNKFTNKMNKVGLFLCSPFEKIAQDIRYKQENPDLYEARRVVESCAKVLISLEKKVCKSGKHLNERDMGLITNIKSVYLVLKHQPYKDQLKNIIDTFLVNVKDVYLNKMEKIQDKVCELEKFGGE